MSEQPRLPFNEVETSCLTCGKPVIRPRKRSGRHSRFCSWNCWHARKLVHSAAHRERQRVPPLLAYIADKVDA